MGHNRSSGKSTLNPKSLSSNAFVKALHHHHPHPRPISAVRPNNDFSISSKDAPNRFIVLPIDRMRSSRCCEQATRG